MLTVSYGDKQCCKREVLSGQASHARNTKYISMHWQGDGWEWERQSCEDCEVRTTGKADP